MEDQPGWIDTDLRTVGRSEHLGDPASSILVLGSSIIARHTHGIKLSGGSTSGMVKRMLV